MDNTPRGFRKHVAIFGKANAGKSTLFNLITDQKNAIVSNLPGTTTDPVSKSMELIPFGPIVLIDTAGLDDVSELGGKRTKKTLEIARRADVGIILEDVNHLDIDSRGETAFFKGHKLHVFTKCDLANADTIRRAKEKHPHAFFISKNDSASISALKNALADKLKDSFAPEQETMIGGLLDGAETVVLVVPIDSEAPKGRLILPQVQLIRDCLDNGVTACVTRDTELSSMLKNLKSVGMVVTDSQAFSTVASIVPEEIPLTSFSMLLARQKGDFNQFLKGIEHIENLKDNDKILMLEACTHNHNHEDIGRVKIPRMLNRHTGKQLNYVFHSGYNMPEDLSEVAMVIMCGGCMINRREVLSRLQICENQHIPATNYGILLAYLGGILDRCAKIFRRETQL